MSINIGEFRNDLKDEKPWRSTEHAEFNYWWATVKTDRRDTTFKEDAAVLRAMTDDELGQLYFEFKMWGGEE